MRQRHLREIVGLLQPGGCGGLVTDFVASDSWPELASLEEQLLPQAVAEQLRRSNFFTGVNPLVIGRQLIQTPPFNSLATKVGLTQAWKWRLGTRAYAVCGIRFQRTEQTPA